MTYADSLIDLVRDVIEGMTFPVTITSIDSSVLTAQVIGVDDLYHAQAGFKVTIDAVEYTISSVDYTTKELTLSGTVAITAVTFDMYTPFFFHGHPIEASKEIDDEKNSLEKTPMVYMLEEFTEDFDEDPESSIERTSTVDLFFLTQCDFDDYTTADTHHHCVTPMRRLIDWFKANLELAARFETSNMKSKITNKLRFGVYISNRGVEKTLFVDNLAGAQLRLTCDILKAKICSDDQSFPAPNTNAPDSFCESVMSCLEGSEEFCALVNACVVIPEVNDASFTEKGIVRMSIAPVVAADPIAVGDNDPRNTNARTPTAHAASHTDGTDDIQLATKTQKGLLSSSDYRRFKNASNLFMTKITY